MILPIISVQHDFQTVISDVNDGAIVDEDFWVSCYKTGESSVHGKVCVSLGDRGREVQLASRECVVFAQEERGHYFVSCASLAIPKTRVQVPRHSIRDTENPRQITALSVAPDLSQVVVGHADGTIRRLPYRASDALTPLTYTPHLSGTSVTTLRYFPSSRVVLSGGADFALHILDADEQTPSLKPVRSLKGHVRAVTDTAIVARGRNVLSGAKDGTLRLWDVGSGTQIRVMGAQKYAGINALSLGETPAGWSTAVDAPQADAREVETAGKLVVAGLQDGHFECFDLAAKASAFHSSSSSQGYKADGALTSVSFSASVGLVATGSAKGVVTVFDTRSLRAPVCAFQRNGASVEGLSFTRSGSIAVVTEDGLPFVAGIRPDREPEVLAELAAGADCEATRVVHVDESGGIWVAGDDGVVRMY